MSQVQLSIAAAMLLGIASTAHADADAAAVASPQAVEPPKDFHGRMMESTFLMEGPGPTPGTMVYGSCFLLGEPDPADAQKGRLVLVTAHHVIRDIQGENATVYLRTRDSTGEYAERPWPVRIREKGRLTWTTHRDPEVDVAATRVRLPKDAYVFNVPVISTALLVDDASLMKLEIHPGDELHCLGFPRALNVGPGRFPVLRSGKIASYPIVPTARTKFILFDFNVFPGNSGGPVYFVEHSRTFGGAMQLGTRSTFLAGIVTKSVGPKEPLGLGVVVHAQFIREVIATLPKAQ